MKTFLLLLFVVCAFKGASQNIDINKRKPWEDVKKKMLQQKLLFNDLLKENKTTVSDTVIDKSVLKIKLDLKYIGNNGKGADVYAMMPHGMPCIVPDSTFHSNMPVTNFNGEPKPGIR